MKRVCAECRASYTPRRRGVSRCDDCQRLWEARRNAERGSFAERYGADWPAIRRRVIAAEPWCHRLGGCPHADSGAFSNPLCVDHIDPRGGNGPENLTVLCRRCNGAKGASERGRGRTTPPLVG